ncbi:MAG TPA: hypothetical protein VL333_13260 [Candidatus Saccharimonadales bacterium]|nr:hypothetical protein [Candidatus Saccharimonadales bacterium]
MIPGGFPVAGAPLAEGVESPGAIGNATLPMFTSDASGLARATAMSSAFLPAMGPASGAAAAPAEGTGAAILPMFTSVAPAKARATARGAALLPMLTANITMNTAARRSLRSWQQCPRPASGFTVCADVTVGSLREGPQ